MKKSSKTKPKEVAFIDDRKSRPGQSRNEPTIKPSLHPWYYVKGRPDLTEKNISSRREREEQKHRNSVTNSQYFDKQMAETQVYRNWSDNKSLVKHSKPFSNYALNPPYDVFVETKSKPGIDIRLNKEFKKNYSTAKQSLTKFQQIFKELDQNCSQLEKRQNILVFQLKELQKIKTNSEEHKKFYEMVSKQLIQNRFSRVKIRKKVFQIIHVLNQYKIDIKKMQLLIDSEVLSGEELTQLTDVIERALKIIEMYILLNGNRNEEFILMYDEELENHWENQEIEWQTEYQVWNVMTEKLIQSFINVLKEKLSEILTEESDALEIRQKSLKELIEFTAKIKSDSQLSSLMSANIEDFLTEVNKNDTK